MSGTSSQGLPYEGSGPSSQLVLDIWHPNCWTLETTAKAPAGLVAQSVYLVEGTAHARVTAYGDTTDAVDELVERIEQSPITKTVQRITKSFGPRSPKPVSGNATEDLLVTYGENNSIHDALTSRGFVPVEAIRIRDGREYWTVVAEGPRSDFEDRLAEVERRMDADIEIRSTGSTATNRWQVLLSQELSERQREVIELARQRGYYEWPRETNASDLAEELGISKTTLLEHLRKAESKIIGQN